MTIPSYTGLGTALSGLEAMQAGIDTTGQNIANASTPGYSDEVVDLTESGALTVPTLSEYGSSVQVGTGVSIGNITRQTDPFLDAQYRTQNTAASNASTLASELGDVQTALDEPSSAGISEQLQDFYQAWNSLSETQNSSTEQAVVSAGQTLAQTFNSVASQISTIQSQASQQYTTLSGSGGELQQYANQIAQLNQQISAQVQAGVTPNTLEDERDQAIDSLSALGSVSVTSNADGTDTITFGGASSPLISGSTVTWPPPTFATASDGTTPDPGGQLGALASLASSDGPIGTLSSSLDSVASQVISEVNALQPSSPFFSGDSASTIAVSATASTVQSSSSSTSGADLATQIAALSNGPAVEAYAAFVGQVGDAVQSANNTNSTAQAVLTSISNQVQSVSGVSLDQEMTNLITYQQGYEASAKMMSTMQSVLNTLIESVGGAGI